MTPVFEISVCVATLRRPEGLERLLASLAGQVPGTPSFEIVVVDNDVAGSAEPVVQARGEGGAGAAADGSAGRPVRYLREPERNIARARNRGLETATGACIAFIDDDETATPAWLSGLHRALVESGADGAFGPVVPRWEEPPPAWIAELGARAGCVPPTGTELPWHDTRTSNGLVRAGCFTDPPARFDERLGRVGGEDVDLFARLIDRGRRFVSAADAVVHEDVPAHRMAWRWHARRALRNGGTIRHVTGRRLGTAARAGQSARAAWKSLTSLGRAGLAWPRDRGRSVAETLRALEQLGIVLGTVGVPVREYERPE